MGMEKQVLFPILTKDVESLPCFVTGIGMYYEENGVDREKGYTDYQWTYCLEGEGILKINGQVYTIKPGMAFFFRKDIPHVYEPTIKTWKTAWITFNGVQVESLLDYMGIGNALVLNIEWMTEMRQRIKEIFYTLNVPLDRQERTIIGSGQLYNFLIFMDQNRKACQNENQIYERLRPVIRYMDTYYAQDITLEDLANQIGVTKYYLCRLFKEAYEHKPIDYLNKIRIKKAKEYLVMQEQVKIKEIGEAVGFKDSSYFCSKFKEYEGCSPLEFKRKYI